MHPLISAYDLMNRLEQDSRPTVLDVRWSLQGPPGRLEYDRGHLPEAVFVDLEVELSGPVGPGTGRHPLPDSAALQATLRRAGVDQERPVVVYDQANGSAAARAWWLLRWSGHLDVRVLDGGYAAWTAAGLPTTSEQPHPGEGDFVVRTGSMPVLDAEGAAGIATEGVLLDARSPERYSGRAEPMENRAGHIPRALNAPFAENTDASGYWNRPADLHAQFVDRGVRGDSEIGVYCGSGVTACSVVLALEHAGVTSAERPAALFPGSWSEWVTDPERPVATSDDDAHW